MNIVAELLIHRISFEQELISFGHKLQLIELMIYSDLSIASLLKMKIIELFFMVLSSDVVIVNFFFDFPRAAAISSTNFFLLTANIQATHQSQR